MACVDAVSAEAVSILLKEEQQEIVISSVTDTSKDVNIVSEEALQEAPQQLVESTSADVVENSVIDDVNVVIGSQLNAVDLQPEIIYEVGTVANDPISAEAIVESASVMQSEQIDLESDLPEQFGALNLEAHLVLESESHEVPDTNIVQQEQQLPVIESTPVENVISMKAASKVKMHIATEEHTSSDTKTVAAWTLKGKKTVNIEDASTESMISPISKSRPAFIDPTASKASRYAAMMAERAAAETEEGWGSASFVSPQPSEESPLGATGDASSAARASPRRHNYVPTQQGNPSAMRTSIFNDC